MNRACRTFIYTAVYCLFTAAMLLTTGCRKSTDTASSVSQAKPPILVETHVDKTQIHIGDLINYTLTVSAASNVHFTLPEFAESLGGFAISDWSFPPAETQSDGRIVRTQKYTMETYLIGVYEIPAPEIIYEIDGATNTISGTPICVDVTSVATNDTAFTGIRDVKDPLSLELQKEKSWKPLIIGIASAIAAAIVVLLIIRHFRTGKEDTAPAPIPAHERAYAALHKLKEKDLLTQGKLKEYFFILSLILRTYIEDRFGLRAPEQTTEEFLQSLHDTPVLESAYRDILDQFLTQSDLVKFANYSASAEEAHTAYNVVIDFVDETRVQNEPPTVEGGDSR